MLKTRLSPGLPRSARSHRVPFQCFFQAASLGTYARYRSRVTSALRSAILRHPPAFGDNGRSGRWLVARHGQLQTASFPLFLMVLRYSSSPTFSLAFLNEIGREDREDQRKEEVGEFWSRGDCRLPDSLSTLRSRDFIFSWGVSFLRSFLSERAIIWQTRGSAALSPFLPRTRTPTEQLPSQPAPPPAVLPSVRPSVSWSSAQGESPQHHAQQQRHVVRRVLSPRLVPPLAAGVLGGL